MEYKISKITCSKCEGKEHFVCPGCKNDRKFDHLPIELRPLIEPCYECHGTGFINCDACSGAGFFFKITEDGENDGSKEVIKFAGRKYQGDLQNGKPHGRGKLFNDDRIIYAGDFKNGLYHGKGFFDNGEKIYEGDFLEGKMTGKGKYTNQFGGFLEGDFVDGKLHGKGKDVGMYIDGLYVKYEGDYVEGKKEGKGKCYWKPGAVYEGDFVNDNRHGKGKYTWDDGSFYEGDFAFIKYCSEFHGKGKLTHANGTVEEGEWVKGKFVG